VEAAVDDRDLHVDEGVPGDHAALHRLLDAIDDRRDVFLRNDAADDLVLDDDTLAPFVGLDVDFGMAVLTATTALADELPSPRGRRP
jgi:hypothetical protein